MTEHSTKVRVGIIGAGAIVRQRHLPGLQTIPGVEVAVVCNRRPETAAAIAKDFKIPEVAENWEDVVRRPDIDVVWIGTTPELHAPVTIAALEAGKHVFCQARMARNLDEARAMLAAAQARPGQVTMLCPPPNAIKHGLYFEDLLRRRCIGSLFHFQLRSLAPVWAESSAPAHWRQRREVSGNNILSVGIYAEVLGRFLGYPLSLCAQGRICIQDRLEYTVRIPDCLQVIGQWPGNLEGVLQWSGVAQFGGSDILEIYGSDGTLAYDFANEQIQLGRRGQEQSSPLPVSPEFVKTWTVERDFIRAVLEGGSPEPSFQTGVRYMEFVEAVDRSMADHAWISLASL
jgi:predicted dehydrogenase